MNEIKEKVEILNQLGTKELGNELNELITEICRLQGERQKVVNENSDFLSFAGRDCEAVKDIEAQLFLVAPEVDDEGKKLTVDKRNAWLEAEKRATESWKQAIAKQREVANILAMLDSDIEKLSRRYSATKAFLELRTAQIQFLGK